ncbi:hypothetical protein [Ancylomarina sp. 16SWW S1-10-2]|uniref:hypothetical protein n=1 Tax=Ancylomarina sp. 16SWW S1-10-2 TaxID=2499681 RepID=UPI0012AE26ED|nr:hypothetical protein [Ancylomarina sp. 16SWW S1-10-2]MRT94072.1 hypothetical protein [Ancylomarina sp. 16SWW S1-10-2]
MKTTRFKLTALLLLISIGISSQVFASDDYIKSFDGKYAVKEGSQLTIENKYGNIEIKNWEVDSVLIKATITTHASNEARAENLFKGIKINIDQIGETIMAFTEMEKNFKTGNKFSIDYEVFMPEYIQISLNNKFGDIYINTVRAKANINLSYGNLLAEKFLYPNEKPLSSINLSYAKATINECNRTKLTLKYSKMNIGTSETLIVVSRFSKLHLDNNISLIANSKYDAFDIINTESVLISKGQYSDIKIDNVSRNLDLNLRYGNCKVENVASDFETINIDNQYVPSRITIADGASYMLEARTKYCGISYPDNSQVITEEKNNSESKIQVLVGNSSSPESKIHVNSEYGNISLK